MEWGAKLMSDAFEFTIGDESFEWDYAHTVYVWGIDSLHYSPWNHVYPDCFSLNDGRDDYTPAEVMAHALEWMNDE